MLNRYRKSYLEYKMTFYPHDSNAIWKTLVKGLAFH